MDLQNEQPRRRNSKEISYDFKISVLKEIANGLISANFASKKYNISRSTLDYWKKKLMDKNMANKQHSANDET
jgi:transposase-like protein